jgi:hypothetical protein
MAINVKMYQFAKRENSTKLPDDTVAFRDFSCSLKSPCGIINPSIELKLNSSENPTSYNYCYIEHFNRYYFITDWTWISGLWEATLRVDSLASFREEIGNSNEYVLRSSADSNGSIIDTLYPAKSIQTQENDSKENELWNVGVDNGTFVVGILGAGETAYYLFRKAGLESLLDYLFSDSYSEAVVGSWSSVFPSLKAQFNPLQYISSVSWFPMSLTETAVTSIKVGYVDVPVAAMEMPTNGVIHLLAEFDLKRHPDSSSRGNYLNNAPFANYELYFPPFGLLTLDANALCNATKLGALCTTDLRTGNGTLNLYTDKERKIGVYHSTISVPIQLSQTISRGNGITSFLNVGISAASTMASAYAGDVAGTVGGFSTLTSGIGNALSNEVPVARSIGANGGYDALRGKCSLQYTWKRQVAEDNEHLGRPLCENRKISELPGYLVILYPDVTISGTQEENTTIKGYMSSGFFYE